MKKAGFPRIQSTWIRVLLLFGTARIVFAQDDSAPHSTEVPNPMGIHTWFIILAVGAFLAWSISYSLQLQREALQKRNSRENLVLRKNKYMDRIAQLDSMKDAGTISEQNYRREFNNTRLRLAKVLEQIDRGVQGSSA
jgi:hypothetical protein